MAIVKGVIRATGSVKDMSFYTVAGSDKVIMRSKGGPSKARLAKGKEFEVVRKHQVEWAACVQFAKALSSAAGTIYSMSDHRVYSAWTGVGKQLMGLDTESEIGKRALRLSSYTQALTGYNLHKAIPFSAVLRVAPVYSIDRQAMAATVTFPPIVTASDLANKAQHPYFRLHISLGAVSDSVFAPNEFGNYQAPCPELQGLSTSASSNWLSCNDELTEQSLQVAFENYFVQLLTAEVSLVLSVGVEFGTVGFGGQIQAAKRGGHGKVLAVV